MSDQEPSICGHPGSYESRIELYKPPHWTTAKGPTYSVDACIASEIERLVRAHGVRTIESCCGHGLNDGYITTDEASYPTMFALGYKPDKYGHFMLDTHKIKHIGPKPSIGIMP